MKTVYADFNDFDTSGELPLTCVGSVASLRTFEGLLRDGEEVWLDDGELRVRVTVHRRPSGDWVARSAEWKFERRGD
ncbi:MAG: hypothetical protein EPO68_18130 [Planctomycetota bacterium]|nr:MAG: hypothetical protein EPO68_18130 [Planctomycetota bacterium]